MCEDFNNTETAHTWDDGQTGNYWSGYVGAGSDDDGIGDTPFVVDALNLDRYPLMENAVVMPAVAPQLPVDLILVAVVLVVIAVVAVLKRPRKAS